MDPAGYTLHPVSLSGVSCFLILSREGMVLVDCGRSGSEAKILDAVRQLGEDPTRLNLLVLTHAHFDHSGSAAKLKELTGCGIMAHALEADRLRAGFTGLPAGTRWKAKVLVGLGRVFARRLGKFPPVHPDILVDRSADLAEYGIPGKVLHMPGHTPGSMAVHLQGGELIAGDTLFGLPGKQHFPPFAEDLPSLLASWRSLRDLPVRTFYPAHGHPVSRESFESEFEPAMDRYGGRQGRAARKGRNPVNR